MNIGSSSGFFTKLPKIYYFKFNLEYIGSPLLEMTFYDFFLTFKFGDKRKQIKTALYYLSSREDVS